MYRFISLLIALAAIIVCVASAVGADESRGLRVAPFTVERTGTLAQPSLREISGMAVSRRTDNIIWVHNDSGSRAQIHAISPDGVEHARVAIRGATSRDWEDMAAFMFEGRPMLVVADVGDNDAKRSTAWLHFFEEPPIGPATPDEELTVEVEWSVPFRFPDGPADCESVAVDVVSGQVLLLTKRENPPRLYSLPIRPDGALPSRGTRIEATLLGPVATIPRPRAEDLLADAMFGAYSSQPTAMDLVGDELLILTYRHAYSYSRSEDGNWGTATSRAPSIVLLPRMKQSESLAFDRSGRDVYVTSERRNAPIFRLRRTGAEGALTAPAGLK
jgi:hypothetical protein